MLRWWWPGGDVTQPGIAAELAAAIAAGFGGFEIQPFRAGLTAATGDRAARIDSYGLAAFFAHVGDAARFAAAHGAAMDYTLGSGWPTGGVAVSPEHAALELRSAAITVLGPARFQGRVPMPAPHAPPAVDQIMPPPAGQALPADDLRRLAARSRLVAVLAVQGDAPRLVARPQSPGSFFALPDDVARSGVLQPGTTVDLTARVGAGGMLDWQAPPGRWQVITFVQQAEGRRVALAAGTGPQLVLDHLDAGAFAAYAAWHAARLRPLTGHGVRSIFVDSFELTPENPWSADFMAQFQARRGYDLTPYLPLIVLPDWMAPYAPEASHPLYVMNAPGGDPGVRVREDYHRTVSELMQERFFAPLRAWSHAHGYSLRLQAHGAAADLVSSYAFADIPETEDLFDGPVPQFFGYARSAADIYGKPVVSAESMIVVGHALNTTLAQYKSRADLLFASGVAQLVEHGMPYSTGDRTGLGWAPFGSFVGNTFDPANPLFGFLRPLTDYEARIGVVLRATRPVIGVAVYQDALFQHAELDVSGAHADALHAALQAGGYGVDTITLDGLLRSHAQGGGLLSPGGQRYRAVVVPDQAALDARAAAALAHASAEGLPIFWVGQRPSRASGLAAAGADAAVRSAVVRVHAGAPVQASGIVSALRAAGVNPDIQFDRTPVPQFAARSDGARRVVFLANPGGAPLDVSFTVPYRGAVQRWHPWTGAVSAADARADGPGMHIATRLAANASALFLIDPRQAFVAGATPSAQTAEIMSPGAAGWTIDATGYNSAAQSVKVRFQLDRLQDWRSIAQLGNFSGDVQYATQFAIATRPPARTLIDLGDVHDAAHVDLNGCTAGLVMAPWVVDASDAVHHGVNRLRVTVANMPQNGMAGRKLDVTSAVSGTAPAGLLGPLRLLSATATDADVPMLACPPDHAHLKQAT